MKYQVVRTTVEVQEVYADDHADAITKAEHYPFPSEWDSTMHYMVTEA